MQPNNENTAGLMMQAFDFEERAVRTAMREGCSMKDEGGRMKAEVPESVRRGYFEVGACVGTFKDAGIGALSHVAALIRVALEPCNLTELADHCEMSTAGATQVVDTLSRLGLVTREAVFDDRRVWMVTLTEKGRELMSSALEQVERRAAA